MTGSMLVCLMLVGDVLSSQHATKFQHHQDLLLGGVARGKKNSVAMVGVA